MPITRYCHSQTMSREDGCCLDLARIAKIGDDKSAFSSVAEMDGSTSFRDNLKRARTP